MRWTLLIPVVSKSLLGVITVMEKILNSVRAEVGFRFPSLLVSLVSRAVCYWDGFPFHLPSSTCVYYGGLELMLPRIKSVRTRNSRFQVYSVTSPKMLFEHVEDATFLPGITLGCGAKCDSDGSLVPARSFPSVHHELAMCLLRCEGRRVLPK